MCATHIHEICIHNAPSQPTDPTDPTGTTGAAVVMGFDDIEKALGQALKDLGGGI